MFNTRVLITLACFGFASSFAPSRPILSTTPSLSSPTASARIPQSTLLFAADPDLSIIALVAGQENYGLAIVTLGEGIWSFVQAPKSISYAARVLIPAIVAAAVLVGVSGPLVTDTTSSTSVASGLTIATAVSVALGISYGLRLAAPYSLAPKEVAAVGLLVATAGFFSFAQNLVVNGFVLLPQLPSIELPNVGGMLGF